jgi:hypothetical protein
MFNRKLIAMLEARIKALEEELRQEREKYEQRIERLQARLLAKAGVPEVAIAGCSPESLLSMPVFDEVDDDLTDNRRSRVASDEFVG